MSGTAVTVLITLVVTLIFTIFFADPIKRKIENWRRQIALLRRPKYKFIVTHFIDPHAPEFDFTSCVGRQNGLQKLFFFRVTEIKGCLSDIDADALKNLYPGFAGSFYDWVDPGRRTKS
jgi:hypothetical protein